MCLVCCGEGFRVFGVLWGGFDVLWGGDLGRVFRVLSFSMKYIHQARDPRLGGPCE